MGKWHNLLTDSTFKNSRYIKTLEEKIPCKNFKYEYESQYNIMFDVFSTLINLNNIVFSKTDKDVGTKNYELHIELEKCLYGDKPNDGNALKYSVRTIQGLVDKKTRILYNRFQNWYSILCSIDNLSVIPDEIEKQMKSLEKKKFDVIVVGNVCYRKDTNNSKKIYLSKFWDYNCDKKYLEKFVDECYRRNVDIDDKEVVKEETSLLFNLIASANNGLMLKKYPTKNTKQDEYYSLLELVENNADDYLICYYFSKLGIMLDKVDFDLNAKYLGNVTETLMYLGLSNIEFIEDLDLNEEADENYDYLYFIATMEQIKNNEIIFETTNSMLLKILDNLKEVYALIQEEKYDEALTILSEEIKMYKDLFIKVS